MDKAFTQEEILVLLNQLDFKLENTYVTLKWLNGANMRIEIDGERTGSLHMNILLGEDQLLELIKEHVRTEKQINEGRKITSRPR